MTPLDQLFAAIKAINPYLEAHRHAPISTDAARAEVEALRARVAHFTTAVDCYEDALEQIIQAVEDEAYKIVEGQQLCKHIAALNKVHQLALAALADKGITNERD